MNKDNNTNLFRVSSERLYNGILKENPTFVLLLGMCPTLAVTTSAINGLGMGLTTMFVLALSNLFISLLRKVIPNKIRIPAFIVIIASFVTIVELLLKAYLLSLNDALGVYIPLIVVNCIILGRAESYAYSNPPIPSLFDGLGMGLGFAFALTIIGGLREILGAGTIFGFGIMPSSYVPISIFVLAPGAFFVLSLLTAIQNKIKFIGESRGKDMSKVQSGCGGDCLGCTKECKVPLDSRSEKPKQNTTEVKKKDLIKDKEKEEAKTEAEAEALAPSLDESVNEKTDIEEKHEESEDIKEEDESTNVKIEINDDAKSDKSKEEIKPSENKKDKNNSSKDNVVVPKSKKKKTEGSNDNQVKEDIHATEKEEAAIIENIEDASDDQIEFLNLDEYKKVINKSNVSGRKPSRKKSSEKAAQLLMKAESNTKEEK